MALIVDANRTGDFKKPLSNHSTEILLRIRNKRLRITAGGKLLRELMQTRFRDIISELARSGSLERVNDKLVDDETVAISRQKILSDDPHILALARISNTKLLYTSDEDLIRDFKNRAFIDPKGKIVKPTTSNKIACSLFDKFGK